MKELKSFKVDSPTVKIVFMDFVNPEIDRQNHVSIKAAKIETVLTEQKSDYNYSLNVANYLKQNVQPISQFGQFVFDKQQEEKLIARIIMHKYFILSEGRYKMPDTLILNKTTFERFENLFQENLPRLDMAIIVNNYIEDNTLYLISNSEIDKPGYKYVYHIDNDNKYYSDIIAVGSLAHKQAAKLVIY